MNELMNDDVRKFFSFFFSILHIYLFIVCICVNEIEEERKTMEIIWLMVYR